MGLLSRSQTNKQVVKSVDLTGDILKPTAQSTPQSLPQKLPSQPFTLQTLKDTITGIPKAFSEVIGQPSMRAYAGLSSLITGKPFTPTGQFQEELYGTNKPISLTSVGREATMRDPNVESKGVLKLIDPTIGLLAGALDVTPTGKQIKGLLGLTKDARAIIAGTKDVELISKLLKSEVPEMTDDVARGFANIFKDVEDVQSVDSAINRIEFEYKKPGGIGKTTTRTSVIDQSLIPEQKAGLLNKVKSQGFQKSKEWVFDNKLPISDYNIPGNEKSMLEVAKNPGDAYMIRNVEVDLPLRNKGIAQNAYREINRESIQQTGKPLRSSVRDAMTDDAKNTWESLVRKGEAELDTVNDYYKFKVSPTKVELPQSKIPTPQIESGKLPPTSVPPNLSSSYAESVPPEMTPVNKIINALKGAKPVRAEQEALYSAERSRRIKNVINVGKNVPGEKGFFSQLGQLKGELPKAEFEGIRSNLKQSDIDSLFNDIENSHVSPFEKITAKTGLSNLLGAEGAKVPTEGEMKLLAEIFPPEFIKAILDKRPLWDKIKANAVDALNVPRALMSSFDMSAPLRQGIFLIGRPKQWVPAFVEMFKMFGSENAYRAILSDIKNRPTYPLMRESKLAITDITSPSTSAVALNNREEAFMSNLAEQIPGIGKIVRMSDRAYTGFLNKLRADVFDDLVKKADALTPQGTRVKIYKDIAKYVNSATGRGSVGILEKAAPILNATLFSPRLMASRMNLLNPAYYIKLDPFVRKQALKDLLTFSGMVVTMLGLAKLGGAKVETDSTNADFGKIKTGNTRYDIAGGFLPYIRLASQLIQGKVTSSTSGRTITLGEGYKPLTRKDILIRFFESKENPIASFVTGLAQGQTALGGDFNVPAEIMNRLIPMSTQDLYDLYQEDGLKGIIEWLPAPFGVGIQTYGKQELVTGKNKLGEPTSQVRPIQGLGETIIEKTVGKQPIGGSKSFDVQTYYQQLKKLPREEASKIFNEILKTNQDLAKQISDVAEQEKQGITPHDLDLKTKGVASGDRAMAIVKDLEKLKTNEEKSKLWNDYIRKGVITKEVADQITKLLNK